MSYIEKGMEKNENGPAHHIQRASGYGVGVGQGEAPLRTYTPFLDFPGRE